MFFLLTKAHLIINRIYGVIISEVLPQFESMNEDEQEKVVSRIEPALFSLPWCTQHHRLG